EHAASDAKIVTTSGILPLCTAIDFLTRFSREPNIPADFQLLRQTIGAIMSKRRSLLLASLLAVAVASLHAQTVTKETLPGVTNFAKLETTIACAGATTPAAVAGLKQMGYASIINLRLANEPGADIEGETAAAKAAGITFIHLPF